MTATTSSARVLCAVGCGRCIVAPNRSRVGSAAQRRHVCRRRHRRCGCGLAPSVVGTARVEHRAVRRTRRSRGRASRSQQQSRHPDRPWRRPHHRRALRGRSVAGRCRGATGDGRRRHGRRLRVGAVTGSTTRQHRSLVTVGERPIRVGVTALGLCLSPKAGAAVATAFASCHCCSCGRRSADPSTRPARFIHGHLCVPVARVGPP